MKDLGVLVPIVTPCSKSGEPDAEGMRGVCKYMLDAGCDAIFVCGSTGRGPWFSIKQRAAICGTVKDFIGPDVPLFAGCMASGLSDMVENAKALADAGATTAVITAPGYFAYSQEEVEHIFLQFADRCPLPVIIYDIPVFAGVKLDVRTVERLAKHQNVIGFKDSSGDMDKFRELIAALPPDSSYYTLQGKEHLLSESLYAGASGFVVSLLHIDPEVFVALKNAVRSGDRTRADKLQTTITEVMRIISETFLKRAGTSTMFHFFDQILKAKGVCRNMVLEHEGECPQWLTDEAMRAVRVCEEMK